MMNLQYQKGEVVCWLTVQSIICIGAEKYRKTCENSRGLCPDNGPMRVVLPKASVQYTFIYHAMS